MKTSAETLHDMAVAHADRADIIMVYLCWKLAEFLMYVLRGAWNWPSHDHATEQAQSAGHATEQAQSQREIVYVEECDDIDFGNTS